MEIPELEPLECDPDDPAPADAEEPAGPPYAGARMDELGFGAPCVIAAAAVVVVTPPRIGGSEMEGMET